MMHSPSLFDVPGLPRFAVVIEQGIFAPLRTGLVGDYVGL